VVLISAVGKRALYPVERIWFRDTRSRVWSNRSAPVSLAFLPASAWQWRQMYIAGVATTADEDYITCATTCA
jgi:hypothetical protein